MAAQWNKSSIFSINSIKPIFGTTQKKVQRELNGKEKLHSDKFNISDTENLCKNYISQP